MSRTPGATILEYFEYDTKEWRSLLFASLLFGFIISFRQWGVTEFDLLYGFFNLISGTLIALFSLLVPLSVQKIVGLWVGHRVTFVSWFNAWLIGIVVAFASFGHIWLFLPGGIQIKPLAGIRLGRFRYGVNFFTLGNIAYMGTFTNLMLALLFYLLQSNFSNPFFHTLYIVNLLFALYTLLPLPPLNGALMMYGTREGYVFLSTITLLIALLMHVLQPLVTILIAAIAGLGVWLWYFINYE